MRDKCSRVLFILLAAIMTVCLASAPALAATPKATIIRDNYGVPHVYSDNLEGLFIGFCYASAQIRLFQMEMFRRTFWGRLSEIYGEKLLPFDQGNCRDNLTLGEQSLVIFFSSPLPVQSAVWHHSRKLIEEPRTISWTLS